MDDGQPGHGEPLGHDDDMNAIQHAQASAVLDHNGGRTPRALQTPEPMDQTDDQGNNGAAAAIQPRNDAMNAAAASAPLQFHNGGIDQRVIPNLPELNVTDDRVQQARRDIDQGGAPPLAPITPPPNNGAAAAHPNPGVVENKSCVNNRRKTQTDTVMFLRAVSQGMIYHGEMEMCRHIARFQLALFVLVLKALHYTVSTENDTNGDIVISANPIQTRKAVLAAIDIIVRRGQYSQETKIGELISCIYREDREYPNQMMAWFPGTTELLYDAHATDVVLAVNYGGPIPCFDRKQGQPNEVQLTPILDTDSLVEIRGAVQSCYAGTRKPLQRPFAQRSLASLVMTLEEHLDTPGLNYTFAEGFAELKARLRECRDRIAYELMPRDVTGISLF